MRTTKTIQDHDDEADEDDTDDEDNANDVDDETDEDNHVDDADLAALGVSSFKPKHGRPRNHKGKSFQ